MDRNEWLKRCAQRFLDRAECNRAEAFEFARTCYDNEDGESPEDNADIEMSYWEE